MTFAQGSRTRLSIAPEASFGVLPTSPAFVTIPYKSHTLDLTKELIESQDMRGDRLPNEAIHGFRNAAGNIEVDMRRGAYDVLLESALFNTFDTNDELIVGTTPRYMSIEDAALDISQYRQFRGMAVNSMSISMSPGQLVQTTFGMVGKNMTQAGTSLGSPSAASTYRPFKVSGGTIFEGGTGTSDTICIVSSLQFSVTNSLSPAYVILCEDNADTAAEMEFGDTVVEGTVTVYYENATLINKFLNETLSELSVTVDDATGANQYTFYFPRIKYNGASVPVANPQSRLIELPFRAYRDTSEGTNIKITRTSGT